MIEALWTVYLSGVIALSAAWIVFVYPRMDPNPPSSKFYGALVTVLFWPIIAPLGIIYTRATSKKRDED